MAAATAALYEFWIHDFCDAYLEYVCPLSTLHPTSFIPTFARRHGHVAQTKLVFRGADVDDQTNKRRMLLHCCDTFTRLVSPFMPFLAENIYQQLPKWFYLPAVTLSCPPGTTAMQV